MGWGVYHDHEIAHRITLFFLFFHLLFTVLDIGIA